MDLELRGRTAVVVGGSKGIGRAIATRFVDEGVRVGICARGEEALRDAEAALRHKGGEVFAASCDAGDADGLERFVVAARETLGGVDILVNNASAFAFGDEEDDWAASWQVDVMAAVRASRTVVPWMEDAGGGSIINISSISGLEAGSPPSYAAAKAALVSHAKTHAVALGPKGIRFNTVAPGSIEFPDGVWDRWKRDNRPMYDMVLASIPWGRMGTAEEVADVVVFLASPRASWVTGVCLAVDGGQHKGNV